MKKWERNWCLSVHLARNYKGNQKEGVTSKTKTSKKRPETCIEQGKEKVKGIKHLGKIIDTLG